MISALEARNATSGRLRSGPEETVFHSVSTDSRSAGPGCLFVALEGDRFDGHEFIDAAIAGGASGVLCREGRSLDRRDTVFLEVPDTLIGLGDLAAYYRRRFSIPVVAVTGSNGKTTVKEMLHSVLEQGFGEGRVLATAGNFNNLIGLPLTVFRMHGDHRAAVLEMGMNRPGEIARLMEIAVPDAGLVTCVGAAHLEGLGSIEGVAKAKGELFEGLGPDAVAVVNLDDAMVVSQAGRARCRHLGFGRQGEVRAGDDISVGLESVRFRIEHGPVSAWVELPIGGRHNVGNALGAAACGLALGMDLKQVVAGLESFSPPPMRLRPERLPNGVLVVDDTYNANPASLKAGLGLLADADCPRRIVVLGDMRELGSNAAELHERAGADAAALKPELLCAAGDFAGDIGRGATAAGMSPENIVATTAHQTVSAAIAGRWQSGDVVYVKGSRGAAMERVVNGLKELAQTGAESS